LKQGSDTVRAKLVYDLNRYNDPKFVEDQTELAGASLNVKIGSVGPLQQNAIQDR
jgi:hypothetical protein